MTFQKTLLASAVALSYALSASVAFASASNSVTDGDVNDQTATSEATASDQGTAANDDSIAVAIYDNELSDNSLVDSKNDNTDNSLTDSKNDESDHSVNDAYNDDNSIADSYNDGSINTKVKLNLNAIVNLNELESTVTGNDVTLHHDASYASENLIHEGSFQGVAGITQVSQNGGANSSIQQQVTVTAPLELAGH